MGLTNSPFCRRCGAEEETPAHVLCECEALATLRPTYLISIFSWTLNISEFYGQSGTSLKGQGSHNLDIGLRGKKGESKKPTCIGTERARTR
jgi:hypothetical protein